MLQNNKSFYRNVFYSALIFVPYVALNFCKQNTMLFHSAYTVGAAYCDHVGPLKTDNIIGGESYRITVCWNRKEKFTFFFLPFSYISVQSLMEYKRTCTVLISIIRLKLIF